MKITCFCSSVDVQPAFLSEAHVISREFGPHGWELVWGGTADGLMGELARTVQASGGKVHGYNIERLRSFEYIHADTMTYVSSLAERVDRMIADSDAIVVFPGGSGTLDELAHTIETRRLNIHQKPIILCNFDGYYDGLLRYFARAAQEKLQFVYSDPTTKRVASAEELLTLCADGAAVVSALQKVDT
jgi:uncharacterized protein (TIGR00730 family)